ncbi:MAG: hypothetical protein HY831_05035 [Candidatus Aenigmarchaeota archaeon]|nr:hypothetical protein [Candidatus Aenigmarchaeota archaeon]
MNVFVSHAITVGLAILVIIALVLSLNSVNSQWSDFLREYEPKHLCASIQNSVDILYYPYDKSSNMGKLYLNLPKTLAGSSYSIKFNNNTVLIDSKKQYTCKIDNNLSLIGEAYSNNVYLEYTSPNIIRISDV